MRIALIQCSNEPEVVSALERAGMTPVVCSLNESEDALLELDGYVIAGACKAALPVFMQAAEKGKPILGVGEGASVLLEMGLIPGLENNKVAITLVENKHREAAVHMRVSDQYQRNAFTRHVNPSLVLHVPVLNTKTCFMMNDVLLQEIEEQGLNVFQYCDESGAIIDDAPHNIAAIANKAGNVMAVVPQLTRTDVADLIFKSMHDTIKKGVFNRVAPLNYYPRRVPPQ